MGGMEYSVRSPRARAAPFILSKISTQRRLIISDTLLLESSHPTPDYFTLSAHFGALTVFPFRPTTTDHDWRWSLDILWPVSLRQGSTYLTPFTSQALLWLVTSINVPIASVR